MTKKKKIQVIQRIDSPLVNKFLYKHFNKNVTDVEFLNKINNEIYFYIHKKINEFKNNEHLYKIDYNKFTHLLKTELLELYNDLNKI